MTDVSPPDARPPVRARVSANLVRELAPYGLLLGCIVAYARNVPPAEIQPIAYVALLLINPAKLTGQG